MAETLTPRRVARKSILMFVGLAMLVMGLCLLFFSMRSVMEIGGSCGTGTTAQPTSQPCPDGVGVMMMLGIFGGLIGLAVYAVNAFPVNLAPLAWPALFLSLGWNFLDYGINPPPPEDGPIWGWLVCGVVFFLMGGVPLVIGILAVVTGRESQLRTVDADRIRGFGTKTAALVKSSSREEGRSHTRGRAEAARRPARVGSAHEGRVRRRARRGGEGALVNPTTVKRIGIAVQIAAVVFGLWAGITLFEWATGSEVSIGFR